MSLDLLFQDHNPATPLSGARLTELVAAVNEALGVPDKALAARIDDAESLTRAALDRVTVKVPRGERWANVVDYLDPERVPGVTDDRPAFEAARLTGRPVYAPAGTYYLSRSPSWGGGSVFNGDGKGKTIIRLLDSAPGDASLWCNATFTGDTQGYWADFTLDGNAGRQGGVAGGNGTRSSALSLRNVKDWYVDRVSVINPVQHAFDVTNGQLDYPYLGDGVLAGLRSERVWFDQCDGSGFGDDAFTCHSSDYVTFSRCVGFNPRKKENCNAFEIDGDSRYVTLNDNRSFNCYGGVEVKGHHNESSAQGVTINGHVSVQDVRSYHFRHIGHHLGPNPDTGAPGDPRSLSAFDIVATNLVSIFPGNRSGFQEDTTPSALNISAFTNVSITNFTAIGDPSYDFAGESVVTLKYLANNIKLSNFNFRNFKGSGSDIYVTGGFNKADRVIIDGVNSRNSSPKVVGIGSGNPTVSVNNINAVAPATGAQYAVDAGYSTTGFTLGGVIQLTGYPVEVRFNSEDFTAARFRRRTAPAPAGVARLIDLDTTVEAYYFTTTEWTALTDTPAGHGGANIVEHSRTPGNNWIQTATRNTTGATLQTRSWRIIDTSTKVAGPWNRASINDLVPIAGVLAASATPPPGTPAGTIYLVRS